MAEARRGLFLDLDGTLAESLAVMRAAYFAFLEAYGRRGSDAEFESLNGPLLCDVVALLADRHGLGEAPERLQAVYEDKIDFGYSSVRPAAGARDLLQAAMVKGWTRVIVTSNSRARTRSWLLSTELNGYIDHIVAQDDVRRGKPDPEPYRVALRISGCRPEDSVAVEDSEAGLAAASACAITVFRYAPNGEAPEQVGARTISSLSELIPVMERMTPAGHDGDH